MARSARTMALGPQHLAKVAREVARGAGPVGVTRVTDAELEEQADRFLDQLGGASFWIFAYGSLIWKPGFDHVDARRGVVHGWRRSFCLNLTHWRATEDEPGLMLALQRGGACSGIAYQMPPDDPKGRMIRLLRREVGYREEMPWQRCVTVRCGTDRLQALAFYCAPAEDPDLMLMPVAEQARRIARAVGYMGSCAEYLYNTVSHLEALGIRDPYLWDLQARVASEIDQF